MDVAPIITMANRYRFAPGEAIAHGPVASCMQLWCEHGAGRIWCNGAELDLLPGRVALLPWGRHMRYAAAARRPFVLAAIHLVPRAPRSSPPAQDRVPHDGRILPGCGDSDPPMVPSAQIVNWDLAGPWAQLSAALIALHQQARVAGAGLAGGARQAAAELLLTQWRSGTGDAAATDPVCVAIRALVGRAPARRITLADLVAACGVSAAGVARATRRAVGCAPLAYVRRLKLARAAEALASTGIGLAELADQLGFADAFHLSRRFRGEYGQSPQRWRERQRRW